MTTYDDYIIMLKNSLKNLWYAGVICDSEYYKIRDNILKIMENYQEKRAKR